MEFDKSKILTVVTADQAKVGQKGWFSDNLMNLEVQIKSNSPKGVISEIYPRRAPLRFVDEDTITWNLFYPAPEPTYRPYNNDELNDLVGKIVVFTRDGNKMLVIERHSPTKVRVGWGWIYTAEQLLEWFTLDGEPCGIKEEK